MNSPSQMGPLYLRVSAALEKRIDDGEFRPGDRLPGDLALSAEYGVSVITARAAMRVLIDKLKVVRYPGKGTFVRRNDDNPVWGLGSMFDLVLTGFQTKLILLDRRYVLPPASIANKFGISRQSKLYVVRTARESQGQRFSISDVYYRPQNAKRMSQVDFEDEASQKTLMITVFQEQTGVRAKETYQTITAQVATAEDARKLNIKIGDPLLVAFRDYYDSAGQIIQAGCTKYRVDRYEYRLSLSSPHRPQSPLSDADHHRAKSQKSLIG